MLRRHPLGLGRTLALAAVALISLSAGQARAIVLTSGCANATSCTLAELFAGGSIWVNTKIFGSWELEFIDSDGVLPNFAQVVVAGQDDGGLNPGNGILFRGNGELVVTGADRLDMAIGFTVTELASTVDMDGNSLGIVSEVVLGSGLLQVGEFVADGSGVGIGQKLVETDPAFGPPIATDAIQFPFLRKQLTIEKDILLQGSGAADFAELDAFEQRFSQVPEPGAALMLCVGASVLWALRRLRSAGGRAAQRTTSTCIELRRTIS
jgi:hypothetical protein